MRSLTYPDDFSKDRCDDLHDPADDLSSPSPSFWHEDTGLWTAYYLAENIDCDFHQAGYISVARNDAQWARAQGEVADWLSRRSPKWESEPLR